jgi:hypothetical protein
MARHPRTYKTSNGTNTPKREIRYTTSKEIGVIEKKRPKLKHPLRTRTPQHTNTAGFMGQTRQYSGEKDKQHNTDFQGQKGSVQITGLIAEALPQ